MTKRDLLPTACILCECNCGIQAELGGDSGRDLVSIRGDKRHPASLGYVCEKAQRLNFYQNGPDRLTTPLRRRPDGSYEPVDWETAIAEVAAKLAAVRDAHGGDSIFYYGGGGQGNHLPGAYATATRKALKSRFRSSALAQEKTGEFWVANRMIGSATRADFEHCDVALFIGKNPWYSHSIQRARVVLGELANAPDRCLIVIDPRRTKTAAMANIHLQVKPGMDAWLLSAMVALLLQAGDLDDAFLVANTEGLDAVTAAFGSIDVGDYCKRAGVAEAQVREATKAIGQAKRLSTMEDLGVQMNRHSTLCSYLHRLLFLLTGNLGKPGTHYVPTTLVNFTGGASKHLSPVTGSKIVSGLVPCNVIADEILTDHPKRFRAMIVEAANPVHSLADSHRMREAMAALEFSVCIDVAMSETARHSDYVLPAASQYEKAEATFFNFEFPKNYFQLRHRLFAPPKGPLPEAEIHARLCEALGAITEDDLTPLRQAAAQGRPEFAQAFAMTAMGDPRLAGQASVLLYRSLGPTLPEGTQEGAVLFGLALRFAMANGASLARAGFDGSPLEAASAMFDALIGKPEGFVFAIDEWADVLPAIARANKTIHLALDDMLAEVASLAATGPAKDPSFPYTLSAGERRAFTANTIIRDPAWRKKDPEGALRMSPADAAKLNVTTGDQLRLTTARGQCTVTVAVSDTMQAGHISLPNGLGLGKATANTLGGVAPNELTATAHCDPFVKTPWHKNVPARLEPLPVTRA